MEGFTSISRGKFASDKPLLDRPEDHKLRRYDSKEHERGAAGGDRELGLIGSGDVGVHGEPGAPEHDKDAAPDDVEYRAAVIRLSRAVAGRRLVWTEDGSENWRSWDGAQADCGCEARDGEE
jgi:hypothetical protein